MKIKSFIFASIIYIAFIGGFAFFLDLGDYTLSIESFSLTLPIAIWFVAPLLIFFILALLHLSFYIPLDSGIFLKMRINLKILLKICF